MVTGIRFQKMKKAVLDHVLGMTNPATVDEIGESARYPARAADTSTHTRSRDIRPRAILPSHNATSSTIIPATSNETTVQAADLSATDMNPAPGTSLIEHLLSIVAAEVGVAPKDITDETLFGDLGVDSLMAITVLSTLRNELDIDLPPTFFMDRGTVGAAKQALLHQMHQDEGVNVENLPMPSSSVSSSGEVDFTDRSTPPKSPVDQSDISSVGNDSEETKATWVHVDGPVEKNMDQTQRHRPEEKTSAPIIPTIPKAVAEESSQEAICKIVHLQGATPEQVFPDNAGPIPIFLLADETGSSINYIQLPNPTKQHSVYGVDWPTDIDLDTNPERILRSLADAMAFSIASHHTPPYIIGGASFGAVLAAEVGRRLHAKGAVASLLLLDPPAAGAGGAADVLGTRDRLARKRVLRPAQGLSIEAAASVVEGYRFEAWSPRDCISVAVLVPDGGEIDGKEGWGRWNVSMPGAEVRVVKGAQAGGFLKFPSLNAVGQVWQDILNGM